MIVQDIIQDKYSFSVLEKYQELPKWFSRSKNPNQAERDFNEHGWFIYIHSQRVNASMDWWDLDIWVVKKYKDPETVVEIGGGCGVHMVTVKIFELWAGNIPPTMISGLMEDIRQELIQMGIEEQYVLKKL